MPQSDLSLDREPKNEIARALRKAELEGSDILAGFSMEFGVSMGSRFGEQPEYETRLSATGDGTARLWRRRDSGDSAKEKPGRFKGTVPADELRQLLAELALDPFQGLAPVMKSPGEGTMSLQVVVDGRLHSWRWSTASLARQTSLNPMMSLIYRWGSNGLDVPVWSLALSVADVVFSGNRAKGRIGLGNLGTETVSVLHPASSVPGGKCGLRLRYGRKEEVQPGFGELPLELKWNLLPLHSLGHIGIVTLEPGKVWELEIDCLLDSALPAKWLGCLEFFSYAGFDTIAGQTLFGGAVFSPEFGA